MQPLQRNRIEPAETRRPRTGRIERLCAQQQLLGPRLVQDLEKIGGVREDDRAHARAVRVRDPERFCLLVAVAIAGEERLEIIAERPRLDRDGQLGLGMPRDQPQHVLATRGEQARVDHVAGDERVLHGTSRRRILRPIGDEESLQRRDLSGFARTAASSAASGAAPASQSARARCRQSRSSSCSRSARRARSRRSSALFRGGGANEVRHPAAPAITATQAAASAA